MKIVKQYTYQETERCQRCGRRLKTTKSKQMGFGPGCYKKYLQEKRKRGRRRLF